MSEYTYVTLHGKWSKYEGELPGFVKFEIDLPGKNFPVKASTKKQETVDAMMAVRDRDATFTLAEKDSQNINPHTNAPYKDRYVNTVEEGFVGHSTTAMGGTGTQSAGGGDTQKDLHPDGVKRINENHVHDMRSRAWAHTINALAHTIPTEPLDAGGTLALYGRLSLLQRLIEGDLLRGAVEPEHGEPGGEVPEDLRDIPF